MNSYTVEDFWKLFYRLSPEIQQQAYRAYELFRHDPFHPGLNFEQVNKRLNIWSARINENYRVLGYREGGEIRWFWIGTHRDYEKMIHRS